MKFRPLLIIFIGFSLRVFVAIWNGFFGPSPMTESDATMMHETASMIAQIGKMDNFSIGFYPYTNLLGFVYGVFVDHLFLGCLLSCLAWYISAYVLLKSFLILKIQEKNVNMALLIYCLLPFSILITSVTLREAYQLLFVNFSMFGLLKIYVEKKRWHWISLLVGLTGAGSLHGALTAFSFLFLAASLMLIAIPKNQDIPWVKITFFGVVSSFILAFGISFFSDLAYALDNGLTSAIENNQAGLIAQDGRANYKSELLISKPADLFLFVPISFIQYMFEPFLWKVSAVSDLLLIVENTVRAFFLWRIFKVLFSSSSKEKRVLVFIIFSYIGLELIWSIGTTNWGTALRHHIPAWGLLLLSYYLAKKIRKV